MNAFYAVRKGRQPGIFLSWSDCQKQIMGYSGAIYKKFKTRAEAEAFLAQEQTDAYGQLRLDLLSDSPTPANTSAAADTDTAMPAVDFLAAAGIPVTTKEAPSCPAGHCIAYVDGSYNNAGAVYGYGVVLLSQEAARSFQGSGNDPELAAMRNVAGEIQGSMRAVTEAIASGFTSIDIYYDYQGIESWADGSWKTNKSGTQAYKAFMQQHSRDIRIRFRKVKAHSGVAYNELVDRLAKEAVGIL